MAFPAWLPLAEASALSNGPLSYAPSFPTGRLRGSTPDIVIRRLGRRHSPDIRDTHPGDRDSKPSGFLMLCEKPEAKEVLLEAGSTPVNVVLRLGGAEGSALPRAAEAPASRAKSMTSLESQAFMEGAGVKGEVRVELEARKLPIVAPRCKALCDGRRRTDVVHPGSAAEGDLDGESGGGCPARGWSPGDGNDVAEETLKRRSVWDRDDKRL